MNKYEMMYIIDSSATEEQRKTLIEKFKEYVISAKGTVENVEKVGLKKFAYLIDRKEQGFYVIMNFTSNPEVPADMQKLMKITDRLVRSMCIRKY